VVTIEIKSVGGDGCENPGQWEGGKFKTDEMEGENGGQGANGKEDDP